MYKNKSANINIILTKSPQILLNLDIFNEEEKVYFYIYISPKNILIDLIYIYFFSNSLIY